MANNITNKQHTQNTDTNEISKTATTYKQQTNMWLQNSCRTNIALNSGKQKDTNMYSKRPHTVKTFSLKTQLLNGGVHYTQV